MAAFPTYTLSCTLCGAQYSPDPFRLSCDEDHRPALLRTTYAKKKITVREELPGLFKFLDWLPVERLLDGGGKSVCYESVDLAQHLGLSHLFISFNGYWPERDAFLFSCSFKELEAYTVLARIPEGHRRSLVVASAGNTGRAFSYIGSRNQVPLCLVIPEDNVEAIWSPDDFHPSVRLLTVEGDYSDAISLAAHMSSQENFFLEGGAANVARRDGMGTTVLDAAMALGRIPDHYFQAVGSGTGGIAAWEATLRLLEDGRFGTRHMQLHLSQNSPFTPITDAWREQRREVGELNVTEAKKRIAQLSATVLSNRCPPYSLAGGLYDALVASQGKMYAVTNAEGERARALFTLLEGIDISPEAGIAVASLCQAVEAGVVKQTDSVLLNITSGGSERVKQDYSLQQMTPSFLFANAAIGNSAISKQLNVCSRQLRSQHTVVSPPFQMQGDIEQ